MIDIHRDMRDAYLDAADGGYDDRPTRSELAAEHAADMDNPYAMRARVARAQKLATVALRLGFTAEDVIDVPREWWENMAEAIELPGNPPSEVTIAMAIGMMAMPSATGLTLPAVTTRPTCDLCHERITVDQPTARHLGATVHADCQHDFEEGWEL